MIAVQVFYSQEFTEEEYIFVSVILMHVFYTLYMKYRMLCIHNRLMINNDDLFWNNGREYTYAHSIE